MDETIGLMAIKPADLAARLKQAFRIEPTAAVGALEELIEETLALVGRTFLASTARRTGPAQGYGGPASRSELKAGLSPVLISRTASLSTSFDVSPAALSRDLSMNGPPTPPSSAATAIPARW